MKPKYDWDLWDICMGCWMAIATSTLFIMLVVIVGVCVDAVFALRAQPATFACEAKRMDYRRVDFSTTVICVPKRLDTRNDTLTIQH